MRALIVVVLLLALGGVPEPAAAAGPAPDCPATFKAFVRRFMDDPAFQRAHVAERLLDESANSAGSTSHRVLRAKLRWPLIASTQELRRQKLELAFDRGQDTITVRTPESDAFQMSYWFRKGPCWTLVRRVEESE